VNPITAFSWSWKALRWRSVTFAALFASTLLGFSVMHALRTGLGAVGLGWFGILILPTVLVAIVARKEREWITDEAQRRRWSRGLIFGSIAIAMIYASLRPHPPASDDSPESLHMVRPHGPPGK
jgi:hypothetical protein